MSSFFGSIFFGVSFLSFTSLFTSVLVVASLHQYCFSSCHYYFPWHGCCFSFHCCCCSFSIVAFLCIVVIVSFCIAIATCFQYLFFHIFVMPLFTLLLLCPLFLLFELVSPPHPPARPPPLAFCMFKVWSFFFGWQLRTWWGFFSILFFLVVLLSF